MFKKKHVCDYFVVAVDHDTVNYKNEKGYTFTRKKTYLIWRCDCGDIIGETVDGHFNLSTFNIAVEADAGKV